MTDDAQKRKTRLMLLYKRLKGGYELSQADRDYLADGIRAHVEGDPDPWSIRPGRGKPKDNINSFPYWSCFYAAFVDPELSRLSKSREAGYAEIGEMLGEDNPISEKTVFNNAKKFRDNGAVWMLPRKAAEKYNRILGRPFSDEVYTDMVQRQSEFIGREVFRN